MRKKVYLHSLKAALIKSGTRLGSPPDPLRIPAGEMLQE